MFGKNSQEEKQAKKLIKNWYQDRYEFVKLQRNILGLIAILSLIGTSASVFAVAKLTESKTFEPYIVEIEKKTGITTIVNDMSVEKYTADEAIRKYFLVQYVMAREGFDLTDYQFKYSKIVRTMSSVPVFQDFRREIALENKDSPLNLQRGSKKLVRIKSMTYLDKDNRKIQIRLYVETRGPMGELLARDHRVLTIDFDFLPYLQLSEEERYVNPLGFQIKGYRNDKEVVKEVTG